MMQSLKEARNQEPIEMFFLCTNLCHDCIVVESKTKKNSFQYTGTSTDEVCLLDMARSVKDFGFYNDRDSETLHVKYTGWGKDKLFKKIKDFPFSSDRKVASTVVQDESGQLFVFVKGADSSMVKMCSEKSNEAMEAEAEQFAAQGLRTLVFGYKRISGPPTHCNLAKDSSYTGLPNLPTEAMDEHHTEWDGVTAADVECDLTLVAVTAVEDLL